MIKLNIANVEARQITEIQYDILYHINYYIIIEYMVL